MPSQEELKSASVNISKDIIKKISPKTDTNDCEIYVDEFFSNPSNKDLISKNDKKFAFTSAELTLVSELLLPLVCSIVIDYVREYIKEYEKYKRTLEKDTIREKAMNTAIEQGLPKEQAIVLSIELADALTTYKFNKK
jgi:hypothetical protein